MSFETIFNFLHNLFGIFGDFFLGIFEFLTSSISFGGTELPILVVLFGSGFATWVLFKAILG